ncbi:MAG: hypothetical protein AMXMBFR33_16360 [Candidatus Xenobia bacterium]
MILVGPLLRPRNGTSGSVKAELIPSLYDALLPLLVMDQTVKQGAPPIDCDPFVGGQEKFLSFQVGEQKVEQDKATVIVYTRVGRDPRPEASVVLPHRVMLIQSNGHWKIDDIQGRRQPPGDDRGDSEGELNLPGA